MANLTQAKIAKELKISQSTVSLVIADPMTRRVSAKTRGLIFDYINRVDPSFVVHRKHIGDICLLTTAGYNDSSDIYTRLLDGAELETREQGLNLIFKRWQSVDDFDGIFLDSNIAGIIHCGEVSEDVISKLQQYAPTVLLNYTFARMICSMVTIDNHGAIRQAVEHCYKMNHRQIAYVSPERKCREGHFLDRLGGYCEAIWSLGLPLRSDFIEAVKHDHYQTETVEDVLARLMKLDASPTAIVCANDNIAIGIMKAASAQGISVPEELSVIGFDNTEIGRQWRPALTTIHQKREDMGRAAVTLLTRKIKEGRIDIPEKVFCETELIVRESVCRNE